MSPDRYYCTEIREGPETRRFYFYASTEVLSDPQYGYTVNDSWIAEAYESAIEEIRKQLQAEHDAARDGIVVTVSDPVEVSSDDLVWQNPRLNVYVEDAVKLAKREIEDAFHPIKVIWYWQTSGDPGDEAIVHLKLSDDTGIFGEGFSLQQLRNESLMKNRVRRLYQDLLELRSRKIIMNLLRGNVGAGKD